MRKQSNIRTLAPTLGDADAEAWAIIKGSPTIAYRADLGRALHSVDAGILLSQLLYWTDGNKMHDPDGWIHKTRAEWTMETGLTRRQQERARECLCQHELIEEEQRGVPPILNYRVNLRSVAALLLNPNIAAAHMVRTVPIDRHEPYQLNGTNRTEQSAPGGPIEGAEPCQLNGTDRTKLHTETTAETTPEITREALSAFWAKTREELVRWRLTARNLAAIDQARLIAVQPPAVTLAAPRLDHELLRLCDKQLRTALTTAVGAPITICRLEAP